MWILADLNLTKLTQTHRLNHLVTEFIGNKTNKQNKNQKHPFITFTILYFRGSSPCPWLLHGWCGVGGEERDLSASLLHVRHWQPVDPIRLLIPVPQSSATLLRLDAAGKPQSRDGQYHRSRQQVISFRCSLERLCLKNIKEKKTHDIVYFSF